jgi:glycosyltransferase involved in cell wall biosynthesis
MTSGNGDRNGLAPAPLKIGLMTPAWPATHTPNGIATAVAHTVAGLETCGHQVTILAHAIDAPSDHPRVMILPPHRMDLIDRLVMRFNPEKALGRMVGKRIASAVRQAIRQHGIEVVVMEETQGWVGELRGRVPIPVVATLHGPWWLHRAFQGPDGDGASDRRERREAAGLQRVDAITAPSQDVLDRTAAEWGLPEVPLAAIPNPVPLPADAPSSDDPARAERILFVGRFELIKGGDVVLDAFARLARMHPTCRLTFAGPDPGVLRPDGGRLHLAEALAAMPEEVRARIDAPGPQSRDQVAALRRGHGITLVASRYETFGGTLAEAMAAGSGVVCTAVGGCKENLVHEETGLLVPSEDPQAMAEACLRLIRDPALAQRLGQAARAYVARRLAPETIGQQLAAFLAPLCRR